jgi:hypothetical protein
LVGIAGCDKSLPGTLIGTLRYGLVRGREREFDFFSMKDMNPLIQRVKCDECRRRIGLVMAMFISSSSHG